MAADVERARCLCGDVVIAITMPPKWVANCFCGMCRRAHGAPYVTWVGVDDANVRVESGSEALNVYDSSPEGRRTSCKRCGTPMLFTSGRWPGETHIARALFDDQADMPVQVHAFVSDRAPWVHLPEDGLPRRGGTSGTEPLTND